MQDACIGVSDHPGIAPKCDLEGTVYDLVPIVYTARLVMLVIGFLIIPATFCKLEIARTIQYYWVLRNLLSI